ncbi:hypothetical protein SBOR_8436 [Sclerotinia borealis F-4128]|uniref:F-box domain-containing protein n=1 Tax=Sclerotinia borealis (strain F-4128) TaxID=1432307 RepID=W9C9D4_SCLBF|nr:hypothetical protein SBOR_8436 [Sclerotinia borealis F-4128]
MDQLPTELLGLILEKKIEMCCCDKNDVLDLRLVCKAFDQILKPSIFKTIQLEFSRFSSFRNIDNHPDQLKTLQSVGPLSSSVYIDMMVVRDPDEIDNLKEVFNSITAMVPEMADLIESLRDYCLHKNTFIEEDYNRLVSRVLQSGPRITRLKVNLPFQVAGNSSMTATRLFANTLSCVANRPEEHRKIDTMVLDHITDKTINNIFNVPIDVENAFKTFENLKNLVISIKRQESRESLQMIFTRNIWLLIRKAQDLESLCIIGWNVTRNMKSRRNSSRIPFSEWSMRSISYHPSEGPVLNRLRYMELKRLDIDSLMLLCLIKENSHSLTELYLNEVYLKVCGSSDEENTSLWIGYPNANIPEPEKSTWIAPAIREIKGLNLKILRVSNLGYDDYNPDPGSANPNYDLDDPTGHNRSFDERFVEAVMGTKALLPLELILSDASSEVKDTKGKQINTGIDPDTYDVELYQINRKLPSSYRRCIDGIFFNHTEGALKELQKMINVADRGMMLISKEIDRNNGLVVDHASGVLVNPPTGT